jgi:hypothetical protein
MFSSDTRGKLEQLTTKTQRIRFKAKPDPAKGQRLVLRLNLGVIFARSVNPV